MREPIRLLPLAIGMACILGAVIFMFQGGWNGRGGVIVTEADTPTKFWGGVLLMVCVGLSWIYFGLRRKI